MTRAVAQIDHSALTHNLQTVRVAAPGVDIMAVVKADAYGHGAVPVAATARRSGATWLGVALPGEALELRHAGDQGRILAWLWSPGDPDLPGCIASDVDLSVSSLWALDEIAEIAHAQGQRARIQVKVDTGLTRNGLPPQDLPALIRQLADVHRHIEPVGLWSHLADGETPGHPSVAEQRALFESCVSTWRAAGLPTDVIHLANSGATFAHPDCHYGMVRVGIAMYGLSAGHHAAADLGLRPVMTLRARLAHVKTVPSGTAVSYGGEWRSSDRTTVGLVPLGYADGIPRAASNRAFVQLNGRHLPVVGRVAMDQFVVDLGPHSTAKAGDEVVVFGADPAADQWGTWSDSIGYEIVTRIGTRVPRVHVRDGKVLRDNEHHGA
jgi:alanine racemase